MKKGNIVTFKNYATENTPGRPDSPYACTGVVVAENSGNVNNGPLYDDRCVLLVIDGSKWCEVLWSNNQVTRCYKDDLKVWQEDAA